MSLVLLYMLVELPILVAAVLGPFKFKRLKKWQDAKRHISNVQCPRPFTVLAIEGKLDCYRLAWCLHAFNTF
jgi:hypothetical protein